ncbi:MAG: hypothetical protein JNM94_13970 [Phycisphaerae bacterium]|nr:hypothetical protein [Phycisphaerae bacterium]
MRCKKCDYPLWTIAARACPECGEPFKPSDFEFRRGAVKFCCPHCRQEYYGTSALGHLEPREFDCVRCGTHVELDEMVLEPADAVGLDSQAMRDGKSNPWIDREGRNVVSAWFRGASMLLSTPTDFGSSLPASTPMGNAVGFCAIGVAILAFVSLLCASPLLALMIGTAGAGPGAGAFLSTLLLSVAQPIAITLVLVPVAACIAHAILLVSGGTEHGFGRTMQAMLYAEGATSLLAVIPCLGYLSRIWWVVMVALLLTSMQRVSGVRAACAAVPTVILPLLVFFAFVLTPILGVGTAMSGGAGPGVVGTIQVSGESFAGSLAQDADLSDYVWPATPLDCVADGNGSGEALLELVAPEGTALGIGSALRSDIVFGASNENVRAAAKELAAKLPPNDAPFRIGNAVFTYRGIPKAAFDTGQVHQLWLIVAFPADPAEPIRAFTDGLTEEIDPAMFDSRMAAQNALRAAAGLPPLPSLQTLPDLRGVQ